MVTLLLEPLPAAAVDAAGAAALELAEPEPDDVELLEPELLESLSLSPSDDEAELRD